MIASADAESSDESSVGASSLEPAAPAMVATLEELVQGEGMRGAHMLVWLGDFNYRIDGGYEAVKERAIRNELVPLLELVSPCLATGACQNRHLSLLY